MPVISIRTPRAEAGASQAPSMKVLSKCDTCATAVMIPTIEAEIDRGSIVLRPRITEAFTFNGINKLDSFERVARNETKAKNPSHVYTTTTLRQSCGGSCLKIGSPFLRDGRHGSAINAP